MADVWAQGWRWEGAVSHSGGRGQGRAWYRARYQRSPSRPKLVTKRATTLQLLVEIPVSIELRESSTTLNPGNPDTWRHAIPLVTHFYVYRIRSIQYYSPSFKRFWIGFYLRVMSEHFRAAPSLPIVDFNIGVNCLFNTCFDKAAINNSAVWCKRFVKCRR